MWCLWLSAAVWLGLGAVAWAKCSKIVWWEWLAGGATAFVVAGITQALMVMSMTADVQTLSGQIASARYQPRWLEYYEEAVYRTEYYYTTDSKGRRTRHSRRVFDHWEPEQRWHPDKWSKDDTFGRSWSIDRGEYEGIVAAFGKTNLVTGSRSTWEHNSRMLSGDPNDYVAVNVKGYIFPVTKVESWTNRVKAAPSAFSFAEVPKDSTPFPYPDNRDPFVSDRLLGTAAATIPTFMWDQMNARLGPTKHVNVIAVGLGPDATITAAKIQQAAWVGGKKNDLVICYGGGAQDGNPAWTYAFGWPENAEVLYQIQDAFQSTKPNAGVIAVIEPLIVKHYQIRDWSEFDYLTVDPPLSAFIWFYVVSAAVQGGLWAFFWYNELDKEPDAARSAA